MAVARVYFLSCQIFCLLRPHVLPLGSPYSFLAFFQLSSYNLFFPSSSLSTCCFFLIETLPQTSYTLSRSTAKLKNRCSYSKLINNFKLVTAKLYTKHGTLLSMGTWASKQGLHTQKLAPLFFCSLHSWLIITEVIISSYALSVSFLFSLWHLSKFQMLKDELTFLGLAPPTQPPFTL